MLQMDIFNFHRVEYIVVDTGMAVFDREGIAKLASYRQVSAYDCQVARAALGSVELPEGMYRSELRVTDYFLSRLLAKEGGMKIAG